MDTLVAQSRMAAEEGGGCGQAAQQHPPPNVLGSCALLADACDSFRENCIAGLELDAGRIDTLMRNSLMLVTALNTHIGYDKATKVAKKAYEDGSTLVEAIVSLGYMTAEEFEKAVVPTKMVGPQE